jgi:hypothetical protein
MDIKTHTAKHDSFAKLPRTQREHAYRIAREMKPQGAIYIDELIAAHEGLSRRA